MSRIRSVSDIGLRLSEAGEGVAGGSGEDAMRLLRGISRELAICCSL